MAVLKRDELAAAESGDGNIAAAALLGEQLAVAVGAVRLLVLGGELDARQLLLTVGAGEALFVPRFALVRHTAPPDDLCAFGAALSELGFIARHADDLLLAGNEALGSDGLGALHATEALLVPLLAAVLVLPHARLEDVAAAVTAGRELVVVAVRAEKLVLFGGEGPIHERVGAVRALETLFVPMSLFVRQVLRIAPDLFVTFLANVSENLFVALKAVRLILL